MEKTEFSRLLSTCSDVAELFPEGVAFIGGIAVYLHAFNLEQTADLAEFTHDADIYISLADMADLRDIEQITPNRRLSKHQLIKNGFEFDIYTERQSSLIVPYDAIMAHAKTYGVFRVTCLEHLVALKLEAFLDRKGSTKGEKDANDLLRIASVAARGSGKFDASLCAPYLRDEHIELLLAIEKGPFAMSLAQGNAVQAKKIRQEFASLSKSIQRAYAALDEEPTPPRHKG
jgi:hypothetical protein